MENCLSVFTKTEQALSSAVTSKISRELYYRYTQSPYTLMKLSHRSRSVFGSINMKTRPTDRVNACSIRKNIIVISSASVKHFVLQAYGQSPLSVSSITGKRSIQIIAAIGSEKSVRPATDSVR